MDIKSHLGPHFDYEYLARGVYNCNKARDPFGTASQDFYTNNISRNPTQLKIALTRILSKMELEHLNGIDKKHAEEMYKAIWDASDQSQIADALYDCREIAMKLNYPLAN